MHLRVNVLKTSNRKKERKRRKGKLKEGKKAGGFEEVSTTVRTTVLVNFISGLSEQLSGKQRQSQNQSN